MQVENKWLILEIPGAKAGGTNSTRKFGESSSQANLVRNVRGEAVLKVLKRDFVTLCAHSATNQVKWE